ncbi:transcription termination factor NusA [Thermodesulforhabdus norvegica]|uniref:Transcription termination/antitermination protein NusA n=1 Tax=Thermodesulforhabdus norvegica TaxID=39841 RepID=A0A1I4VLL9_9BACT|nr:transcription termination factor NusA [Thermodesulforhabdus norvegica]SFN02168.1 NusA antitermination factor [Thermodesulforhabdus norvegica]
MTANLLQLIDQVSREKGIDRRVLIEALVDAVESAVRKRYGNRVDVEVSFNEETGTIEAYRFHEVVETVDDPETQISLEEAREYDPETEIGDEIGVPLDPENLGRIAAQTAKQIIMQKMRDAEREAVYEEFIHQKGTIVHGIVQRVDRSGITVNLGKAEAFLPASEQIPQDVYRPGDRIRAYVLEVKRSGKGPQIILSRTHPSFLIQLFFTEVPEIQEGIVSVIGAAREPGSRAKIAVVSSDPDVDPVGACVGVKGSRVQKVVQELRGEKIDIVPWNLDPAKFVVNALAPAVVTKVIIDQANQSMEVIVPDDQLSLAIGKRGQNVRLAARLTNWRIDVISESRYERLKDEEYRRLLNLEGMNEELADALFDEGITSVEAFLNTPDEELEDILNLSLPTIRSLKEQARFLVSTPDEDKEEYAGQKDAADDG